MAFSCSVGMEHSSKAVYNEYCQSYTMQYNESLEACVSEDRTAIKKIEWKKESDK